MKRLQCYQSKIKYYLTSYFFRIKSFLCLHPEVSSDRVFSRFSLLLLSISIFSPRQSIHRFVTKLLREYGLMILHLTLYSWPLSLIFQIFFDSSVEFEYSLSARIMDDFQFWSSLLVSRSLVSIYVIFLRRNYFGFIHCIWSEAFPV